MKTIERQIRNHEFEIRFPDERVPDGGTRCYEAQFLVDGVYVNRGDFAAAIDLLSAEAPTR